MKTDWRTEDILDLEYFFHRDQAAGSEAPAPKSAGRRDRRIYLDHIEPEIRKGAPETRRFILRSWLDHRRVGEKAHLPKDAPLPGEVYGEVHRVLSWAFAVLGLLTGAGLASSFLAYTGTQPLNVAYYFGGLILSQFLLMVILLLALTIGWINRSFMRHSILYALVSRLLVRLSLWLRDRTIKTLPGDRRTGMEAALGLVRGRRRVYGSLFYWPIFILTQLFGVCFNIGVIAATLIKILASDIAFGWQSTVQFSPEVVHDLVRTIALPWSALVPTEIAFPSLAEITGSRMILKEGIYHLATENLISWWPFLCFAVLFYGLIPRLILLLAGRLARSRSLEKLDFEFADCDRLMHRLVSPQVSTEGCPTTGPPRPAGPDGMPPVGPDGGARETSVSGGRLVALVPDDIFEACDDDQLDAVVGSALGYRVAEKIRIGADYEADQAALAALARKDWENGRPHVLLLQEGWLPPIREILLFLKDLRRTLGERGGIEVGLIGKPSPETIFTPVNEDNWNVWRQKVGGLGDPYLRMERLVTDEQ